MSFPVRIISSIFLILLLGCSGGQETQDDEPTEEEIEAHEERKEKLEEADLKKRMEEKGLDSINKKKGGSKKKSSKGKGPSKNNSTFIYHERTPCFGTCPIYKMRVQESGKAELKVEQNMELEEGRYKGTVKQSKLDRVEEKARSIGFFELKKSYDDQDVTDVPTQITELGMGNKEHRVRNRHGGPEGLEELESLLHGIAKNTDWRPAPSNE